MPRIETNEDLVRDIMNYSRHGALIQAFVISALQNYAQRVREAPVEKLDTNFISGVAWKGCAEEVLEKMDKFYGRNKQQSVETE